MEITVLAVPDCPTGGVLRQRLDEVLDGRAGVRVEWRVVRDEGEAVRLGMVGSPTLLVNGTDPFAGGGETASVSCRLYGPEHEAVNGVPSVARLRALVDEVFAVELVAEVAGRGGRGRLAPEEGGLRAVQQAVLRAFAAHGRAPADRELDAAAEPFGVPARQVLAELDAADFLSLDGEGRLRAAYPFSPVPTDHHVRIQDGPRVWAMCAVDALGIAPMLGRDTEIRSLDPVNGREVTVYFRRGQVAWTPESAVVLASSGSCSGPAVDVCCSALNFFTDRTSAASWAENHPDMHAVPLSLRQAESLAREIFGPLLAK
ncbi:alkylmercury lyase family protein [Streptomyces reniochalinae]|uniref:Alkylmercury lyase n=1 Tax=Streptomyces reniochalinae TaxID=2250578 RepID=A0A367EAB2_9ACTN|nr:alkylmercury lyase family protein [Streptomyces reniochalinae]RCG14961.1 alkylmercury lyase [Streptomyces reniochalinae]